MSFHPDKCQPPSTSSGRGTRFSVSTASMAIPSSLPKETKYLGVKLLRRLSLGFAHHQQKQLDSRVLEAEPEGGAPCVTIMSRSKRTKPWWGRRWSSLALSGTRTWRKTSTSCRQFRGGPPVGRSTGIDRPPASTRNSGDGLSNRADYKQSRAPFFKYHHGEVVINSNIIPAPNSAPPLPPNKINSTVTERTYHLPACSKCLPGDVSRWGTVWDTTANTPSSLGPPPSGTAFPPEVATAHAVEMFK